MITCAHPGCDREVMTSSGGAVYAHCTAHIRQLLSEAFTPEERLPEWRRRMEEGRLPAKDFTRS